MAKDRKNVKLKGLTSSNEFFRHLIQNLTLFMKEFGQHLVLWTSVYGASTGQDNGDFVQLFYETRRQEF